MHDLVADTRKSNNLLLQFLILSIMYVCGQAIEDEKIAKEAKKREAEEKAAAEKKQQGKKPAAGSAAAVVEERSVRVVSCSCC